MFGHGQVEGFREKYGMEYRRAYWDEYPNRGLIARHEWQIFPLLRRRYLFAGMEHFLLYDVFTPDGHVNEDVFAYSNGIGNGLSNGLRHGLTDTNGPDQRALIIYHNKYADTRGWVKTSVGFLDKGAGKMIQKTLAEGLGLRGRERDYVVFRDMTSGLEYIRSSRELAEKGLYVELGAYRCHAFVDFREVFDENGRWAEVCKVLNGAGVASVNGKLDEMFVTVKEEAKSEKEKVKRKKATVKKATEKKEISKKGKAVVIEEGAQKKGTSKKEKPASGKATRKKETD
jgi:hypothetical protein